MFTRGYQWFMIFLSNFAPTDFADLMDLVGICVSSAEEADPWGRDRTTSRCGSSTFPESRRTCDVSPRFFSGDGGQNKAMGETHGYVNWEFDMYIYIDLMLDDFADHLALKTPILLVMARVREFIRSLLGNTHQA